jgi:predicted PhzF superfamily epimerase YddE/YHI9
MISVQGVLMGRPSRIHIAIRTEGEEITEVRVGGQAILVGEGAIHLA